jgi:hypothetical protein
MSDANAVLASITSTARNLVRDFGTFFETEVGPLNVLTIRLPHPLVSAISLQVFVATPTATPGEYTSALTTAWSLDERNGILKFTDSSLLGKRCLISGYHYTWFTDSDLGMHVKQMADEHLWNRHGDYGIFGDVEQEVVALGAVVRALNSLALELALDIDVSTPEGIYIPARQRYGQVIQMMGSWETVYTEKAASLNVGLGALEQFQLRRVAYTTNRLVPLYREREIDDYRYPHRIRPDIPDGETPITSTPEDDIIEITEDMDPRSYEIGWRTIGTTGDYY